MARELAERTRAAAKARDLNRIPLPPDTPIIDERFKSRRDKSQR
jgi:hypothetical protein